MRRSVPPSAEIQTRIDGLLADGMAAEAPQRMLSGLAKLGARLIIQRAVEEEFDAWLGRSRYERRPDAPPGKRNGFRPRRLQTAEGELEISMPQLRNCAEKFVCRVIPDTRTIIRTRPLEALVIGAYVRGLSDRDIESLLKEAAE